MRLLLPFLFALGIFMHAPELLGQSLRNIKAEARGDKVIITYDLDASDAGQKFYVRLYSSHNNYTDPLQHVSGDEGEGVLPGKNKRIEWDAKKEVTSFDGNVTFEVRAKAILPDVYFTNPTAGNNFKRGKTYRVQWTGKAPSTAEIELVRDGQVLQTIGKTGASGDFTWSIPVSQAVGSGFSLQMVDNNRKITTSESFSIKRKIPMFLKFAPAVVAGVVIYLLMGGDGGDDGSLLPDPPGIPNG